MRSRREVAEILKYSSGAVMSQKDKSKSDESHII